MAIEYQVLTEEQQQQAQIARLGQLEAEHYSVGLRLTEVDATISELEAITDPNDAQTAALEAYKSEQQQLLVSQKELESAILTNQSQTAP